MTHDDAPRPQASPDAAIRNAQWAVAVLTVAYFSIPASRVISTQSPLRSACALVALVALAALQLWHTWRGLRAQPQVAWSTALCWQVVLTYLPAPLAGDAWLGVPSFLAASALVVLRRPHNYFVYAAVVLTELPYAALIFDSLDNVAATGLTTAATGLVMYRFIQMASLVREVHEPRAALAQRAVALERLRFARDVHDVLGHLLSAITLKGELAAAMVRARPADAERELAEVADLARSGHREIRDVVSGYRTVPLSSELANVTAVLPSAGVRCTVDAVDLDSIPIDVSVRLAYALREGTTNVLRHSAATWCRISVRHQDGGVSLRMANDGVHNGPQDPSSNGLTGLRERLAAANGWLVAGLLPDGDYELHAYLPLPASRTGLPRVFRAVT